jgi:hypothetical protein
MPAARRISSSSSNEGREPPFTPGAQLDVGLAERGCQLLDLALQIGLAPARRRLRVVAPRERLVCSLEELLLPLCDRRLRHLQTARRLHLRHLASEHAEHDLQLLVAALERLAAHSSPPPWHTTLLCPRNSDPRHGNYTYRVDVTDFGEPGSKPATTPDTYGIKVWSGTSGTYYQLYNPPTPPNSQTFPQLPINGGNIQVRP